MTENGFWFKWIFKLNLRFRINLSLIKIENDDKFTEIKVTFFFCLLFL